MALIRPTVTIRISNTTTQESRGDETKGIREENAKENLWPVSGRDTRTGGWQKRRNHELEELSQRPDNAKEIKK